MKDGLKSVKRYTTFLNILALVTLVLTCLTVYSLLAPFSPMHIEDVKVEKDKVCPLELVAINGTTTLGAGNFNVTIDPLWIKVSGDSKALDVAGVDGSVEGPLIDQDASEELVYVSPPEKGKWKIKFDVDVEGRKGILPRTQHIEIATRNVLSVVDCGDTYNYEQMDR